MVSKQKVSLCLSIVVAALALSALPAIAQQAPNNSTRIVGGSFVPAGNYTWTAALLNSSQNQGCGGSLVAPKWVVTAAHCTASWAAYVRVGSIDRTTGGQVVRVIRRINHPNYNGGLNDIALLELETAVTGITPVPMASAEPSAGTGVRLLGWGSTQPQGNGGSQFLKQLDTSVLSRSSCTTAGAGDLCIQGSISATACYGDSGGPAIVNGVLVGATSRAGGNDSTCGPTHVVYTSVGYFRSWINQYVGGTTPPPPGGQTYTNGTDFTINDNSTVESPITVSGRTGNGSATTPVAVNIVHSYIGDLKVDLIAPDGSVYVLHNRTGSGTDNINQTFTVNLSSEPLNGTWKLRANDNANSDTGYINSWSITF